ncbi:hypothetical protein Krad_2461 [Kineococcus radiotolerans SRS30216 = ATCC BAA-149]|uniref:Uncharacterized protein n=1 Tax=Kineococcus radiotolerans (strain ATCC BAA-149 / DSM 14245 / SRS30216) TaxID=266940 RepID=A6WAU8_KINRD|nr:hypothetical protein Krad_2461 [Kineococcus radiotolerans SRS30216 = ATCC BAA-149]
MTHDQKCYGRHPEGPPPVRRVEDGHAGGSSAGKADADLAFDLSGRWVWRGRGGHAAHLIRDRSTASSTPWTLCGRRMRQPRLAWRGICPTCLSRAEDLAADASADLAAEPVPPREVRDETRD